MGLLIDGTWHDRWYDTDKHGGRFVRKESSFRAWVEDDDDADHPVALGRYHLYVAAACPWAHRILIARALFGLEEALPITVVGTDMLENGWPFTEDDPDPLQGASYLHELYTRADPTYTGRVTVPALWDLQADTIVNNESSELLRMLDGPLARLGRDDAPLAGHDLYPEALRAEIDALNEPIYHRVNNGVYKAGFATTQEAYDEAVTALFDQLEALEDRLQGQRWLAGDTFTEADIRLFTTLLRFDLVYHHHFKCTKRRLRDHPALWAYTREIYQAPRVADTCDLHAIRRHYFYSHDTINPHRILPVFPDIDLDAPHGREAVGGTAPWA